ncbi:MAG: putative Ig domain-containing protein [Phycisphaerales bacterium]|nr:putative Ig domain-containing protein [Phycisphaerales bacterium]
MTKSLARKSGLVLLVIAVAWLAGNGNKVSAFSFFQFAGVNVTWPTGQSIRELSPVTFPEGTDPDTHILAAMGLWNLVPAANFEYFFNRPAQEFPLDHFDGFNDTLAVPAALLDPGVLGITTLVNIGPEWVDMDIEFSDLPEGVGYTFDANPGCEIITEPTPDNGFSFLLIAAHELGHALGLGHDPIGDESPGSSWFIQTMNPRYPNGGPVGQENIIELHTDDRNGLRFLYPPTGPSGPAVVDLANASYTSSDTIGKPVPVWFDTSNILPEILPGEQLTVRSVIENFGTTSEVFVRQGYYLSTDETIETTDLLLGDLQWDIAFEDALEFEVIIDMPEDLATGTYFVGTILDDLDEIAEDFEDNNAVVYCETLTVLQHAPEIDAISQEIVPCGQPYAGPTPTVSRPLNMAPLTWSLDSPPSGMTIDPGSGVISWPNPIQSPFLYQIIIRATNDAGSVTQNFFLGVTSGAPAIVPISDETIGCVSSGTPYIGPTPQITDPGCMEPIINWSLDTGPPGMTINFGTGVVTWPNPVASPTPHMVTVRATNAVGNGTETWLLQVTGDADVDGDTDLDLDDLDVFANVLIGIDSDPNHVSAADMDGSGLADGDDIQSFLDCFLAAP